MYGTTTGLMGTQLEFLYELPYQVYFIYIKVNIFSISSIKQFHFFFLIAGKQTSPPLKTLRSVIVYLEDMLSNVITVWASGPGNQTPSFPHIHVLKQSQPTMITLLELGFLSGQSIDSDG